MTESDYKARLVRLTLTRLAGIGVAAVGGVLIAAPTLPFAVHVIGAVLMIAGIAGMWIIQRRLLRRWRSEE